MTKQDIEKSIKQARALQANKTPVIQESFLNRIMLAIELLLEFAKDNLVKDNQIVGPGWRFWKYFKIIAIVVKVVKIIVLAFNKRDQDIYDQLT